MRLVEDIGCPCYGADMYNFQEWYWVALYQLAEAPGRLTVEETRALGCDFTQRIAEMNTLKSLPPSIPSPQGKPVGKGGNENFHGLVQRLVQKEKQVLQLQTELERFKVQNPEGRDAVGKCGRLHAIKG